MAPAPKQVLAAGAVALSCWAAAGEAQMDKVLKAASEGTLKKDMQLEATGGCQKFGYQGDSACTALMNAAYEDNVKAVQELLSKGADPDTQSGTKKLTALMYSAIDGQSAAAHALLLAGADPNLESDEDGVKKTAAEYARENGHPELESLLLRMDARGALKAARGGLDSLRTWQATPPYGKDLEAWGKCVESEKLHRGCTALMNAAASDKDLTALQALLDAGAKTKTGSALRQWTALHFAADAGNTKAVEVLLERKAKVNAKDSKGQTPLMLAAARGHSACAEHLVAEGAKLIAKREDGKNAFNLASAKDHQNMVDYLEFAFIELVDKDLHKMMKEIKDLPDARLLEGSDSLVEEFEQGSSSISLSVPQGAAFATFGGAMAVLGVAGAALGARAWRGHGAQAPVDAQALLPRAAAAAPAGRV